MSRNRLEYDFLSASRHVPFSEPMRKFFWLAKPDPSEDVAAYANRIVAFIRDQFVYEPGMTKVHSTADEILSVGGGVCQDFAHLTIGVLRLAGIPARYVSGYLAPAAKSDESKPWARKRVTRGWRRNFPGRDGPDSIRLTDAWSTSVT